MFLPSDIHSFIQLIFSMHLLCARGPGLGRQPEQQSPCLYGVYFPAWDIDNEHINKCGKLKQVKRSQECLQRKWNQGLKETPALPPCSMQLHSPSPRYGNNLSVRQWKDKENVV